MALVWFIFLTFIRLVHELANKLIGEILNDYVIRLLLLLLLLLLSLDISL